VSAVSPRPGGSAVRATRGGRAGATLAAALAVVLAGVLAGCGVPTGGAPTTVAASDLPYGLGSPGPAATAAPTTASASQLGWIYLVAPDEAVVPVGREVGTGAAEDRLGELLAALASGPTEDERDDQLSSALPPELVLTVTRIEGGVSTIDLSEAEAEAFSGPRGRRGVAQIVLTAASLPEVDAVLLTSGGEVLEAPLPSGELTDAPLRPIDYAVLQTPPAPPVATTPPSSSAPAPFVADTRPDTAQASPDAAVTVTDVRVGRQQGFDRVVLEVGGTGVPGWDVRYVPEALSQGSGDGVAVAGAQTLRVTVTGAGLPDDTGVVPYSGPDRVRAADTEVVTEAVFDGTFEGTSVAFVGTTARLPFRVYSLGSPTRVVLEVAHTG
jgi:hypothetical protein